MRILRPQQVPTTPCPEQDDGAGFKDRAVASASLWLPPCVDDVDWARIEERSVVTPKLTYDPRPLMTTRAGATIKGPDGKPMRFGELPEQVPISLVRELDGHLVVPRYLCSEETDKVDFESPQLEDVWSQIDFGSRIEPRNVAQKAAWEALSEAGNGTLKLSCGKGKTVMSLKKLAQRGFPGIVLVNNRGLAHQWKLSAMKFLDLEDKDIGMVTSGLSHRDAYHIPDNPKLLAKALVDCDSEMVQLIQQLEKVAGPGFNPLSGKHVQALVNRICTPIERLDYEAGRAKCLHAWADEGKAPFTLLRDYREVLFKHRLLRDRIDGETSVWNRPLVISTIQSLVSGLDDFPQWIRQRFGSVFFDEGHHLPAATFIRAIDVFHGARFSLTATPERDDGLEALMYAHTGGVIYEDMEPEYPAALYFKDLPTRLATEDKAVRKAVFDRQRRINLGMLYQYLAMDRIRNRQIIRQMVIPALNKGRDVLVLAHAQAHPEQLAKALLQVSPTLAKASGVGVITGETSGIDRVRILASCRACFATMGVALEGLDAPKKDTVVMASAFTSWRMLVQSKGRIERLFEGKPQPLYLIVSDTKIDILKGMSWALKRKLQRNGLDYSG
jgi:superfamily II DNA or RNA helicase